MEKFMMLKECSALNQRTVKGNDGSQQVIESFEMVLTDGIDTIMGETSKSVTVQLKNKPAEPGKYYGVSVRLNVVSYTKEGKESRFFKATIIDFKAAG
jgi:hypothetical protein